MESPPRYRAPQGPPRCAQFGLREAGSVRLPAPGPPLQDFVRALRVQAGAIVTPDTEFDPEATDSIRLNFSQNHQAAVQSVERIATMVDRYRQG
ncbi:MAG TPA: hypothetical protein VFU45_02015 [Gemmatimonadales bacterium]|nr:hypothetical protein [Gemmatimonadales bacterium]